MNQEELLARLLSDLTQLNLPVNEVDLIIRPYSRTLYGRYFPVYDEKRVRPKIHIYPYKNKNAELLDYSMIIDTAIHEFCHHIQYSSGTFKRVKGVMHDTEFWKLHHHYTERARKYQIVGGVVDEETE